MNFISISYNFDLFRPLYPIDNLHPPHSMWSSSYMVSPIKIIVVMNSHSFHHHHPRWDQGSNWSWDDGSKWDYTVKSHHEKSCYDDLIMALNIKDHLKIPAMHGLNLYPTFMIMIRTGALVNRTLLGTWQPACTQRPMASPWIMTVRMMIMMMILINGN